MVAHDHTRHPRIFFRWILLAGWPVHAVLVVAALATGVLAAATQQQAILTVLLWLVIHYVFGLCGSYAIHEGGHALMLAHASGVTRLTLERTALRTSAIPHGSICGRDAFGAALAGPGACVLVGIVLWSVAPQLLLHAWYLAHGVFLAPIFNDGRTLLASLRSWSSPLTSRSTTLHRDTNESVS